MKVVKIFKVRDKLVKKIKKIILNMKIDYIFETNEKRHVTFEFGIEGVIENRTKVMELVEKVISKLCAINKCTLIMQVKD